MAKIGIKTALERRRVKQIYQKYRQNKWQRLFHHFQLCLLHYRTKQRLEEFQSDFLKKLFFTDLSMKMITDIDYSV